MPGNVSFCVRTALGIVIAADCDDRDAGALQVCQLRDKEVAGSPVLPVAVIQVAGEHDEVHLLRLGKLDQVDKGLAGRAANPVSRRVRFEAA